jgi:VWFA-related protein
MRLPVASFFLAISLSLPAAIAPAQTTRQRAGKPRNETIKICQGLPIPPGYIIIAYLTSSSCQHGAYMIRKQEPDSQSRVAANRAVRQPAAAATPASDSRPRRVGKATPQTGTAYLSGAAQPQVGNKASPQTDTAYLSGAAQPQNEPPSLRGAEPPPERRPPTLAGAAPVGASVNPTSNPVAPPAGPEEVGEGDVVRINTTLVTVPVSVLDRQGRFVPNLRQEDFSIFENGVEQAVAYFEPSEKPFTVALLLDTSASTRFHLWEIREAAIAFAKQLRPQDRVLIVTFSDEVLLLTEATNDSNIINTVIEENATPGGATRLYDAVALVIKERLNKIKGRKAIVLFTDGVDTASQMATYQSTLRESEELDALIYPIQYDTSDYMRAMQGGPTVTIVTTRSNWPFPGTTSSQTTQRVPLNGGVPLPGTTQADYDRANQYLHQLADKSGGRLYQANNTAQLAQAFSQIAEELRRQYSLGYYPQTATVESGERRQIRVRVRQPNLAVKARDGYVRPSSASPTK